MRHFILAVLVGVTAAAVSLGGILWAQEGSDDHRRSMGNLRPDDNTAVPAIQGSTPFRLPTNSRPNLVVPYPVYRYPYYCAPYNYRYGYYPPYNGYYAPPYYYDYYGYPSYYYRTLPPVYLPAERLYGPQALKRFLGVTR